MSDIPLPEPNKPDIFSFGFDRGMNRGIQDTGTPVVYDMLNGAVNTGSVGNGGNLTLKTLSIGGLVRQVAPGDDIQAAIDAVNREGGGTVQLIAGTFLLRDNIILRSNVALAGAGNGVTVLNFEGRNYSVGSAGNSVEDIKNFAVLNLQIVNSAGAAGLDISYANSFVIENVKVNGCSGVGIRFRGASQFLCFNSESSSNTSDNWLFHALDSIGNVSKFSIINCLGNSGGANGFSLARTDDTGSFTGVLYFSFFNCQASSNTLDGFDFTGDTSTANGFGRFIGNACTGNGVSDIDLNEGSHMTISGNYCGSSTGSGPSISLSGGANIVSFNVVSNQMEDLYSTNGAANSNIWIGNSRPGYTTGNGFSSYQEGSFIQGLMSGSYLEDRKIFYLKNTSGASVPRGAVLVHKSVAAGNEATTTTTNGDSKVAGMSIVGASDGSFSETLATGKTALLLVNNSASSISIGDWLSTYSHAYYAKKAIAGETAFAIALSAPTTGTAAITALLVSPRMI